MCFVKMENKGLRKQSLKDTLRKTVLVKRNGMTPKHLRSSKGPTCDKARAELSAREPQTMQGDSALCSSSIMEKENDI